MERGHLPSNSSSKTAGSMNADRVASMVKGSQVIAIGQI